MNINRDNYEEYFLLYADDELTDSEKAEVLLFVKNNKDLEEEFRMIHHTISRADVHVKLDSKDFLLKNESSFITEKNYEEVFILYHDNELSANERLQTGKFLALHGELKNEFDLIALARLTAESNIVCTNKKTLYKKEKSGKVVPLIMWRMLAVAVFIGFVLWVININIQKPAALNQAIVHTVPLKNFPPVKTIINVKKDTNDLIAHNEKEKNSLLKKNSEVVASQKFSQQKNNNALVKTNFNKEKTFARDVKKQLPGEANDEEIVLNKAIKNISEAEITASHNMKPEKLLVRNTVIKKAGEALPVNSVISISDKENVQAKNDNYVFYDITATEFKKTKVSGFLKKIKRVIVRNNPIGRLLSGDDRQVVSN